MPRLVILLALVLLLAVPAAAQREELPAITVKTAAMEKLEGFFPLYWEARTGKLWLEV